MSTDLNWVDRLYSQFLGRDLTYVASGLAVILIVQWAWLGRSSVFDELSVEFFGWLVLGYFVGLLGTEFAHSLGLLDKQPALLKGVEHYLELREKVRRECHPQTLQDHERTIFLMHVGGAVLWSAYSGP